MTLAHRLRSETPEERRAAIAEIATRTAVDPAELESLVACLGHPAKAIQRPAADAFRALAEQGIAVEALLTAALDALDPRLRFGAAYALARLGPPPPAALPALLAALSLDDGDVRWAAADLIGRTEPRTMAVAGLLPLVAGGNAPQRKMALYCLRDLDAAGDEVERAALTALDDADGGVRLAAMATLARLAKNNRPAAANGILKALNAEDPRERRAAAAALGDLALDTSAVRAALENAARSDDASLRRAADRSLRTLGSAPRGQ
jgi:HEAT repeat protein